MKAQPNDWVRSFSAGVWQIVRIVPTHFETRFSLKDPKELYDGPLVIVKRILNNKWKRAFDMEAVHHSLLKPLTKADAKKLQTFCAKNPDLLDFFAAYERPLKQVLNIGFALKRKADIKLLRSQISASIAESLAKGMTSDQILKAIRASSFSDSCGEMPQSATLQFVNHDYEIRRRELVYREMEVLDF